MSQYIHIRLDPVTYLKIKSSGENMSKLGNRLFESYFELQNEEIPEEIELLEEMKKQEETIKQAKEKLSQISVMLAKVREENRIKAKEEEEIKKDQHDLMRQMLSAQERGGF